MKEFTNAYMSCVFSKKTTERLCYQVCVILTRHKQYLGFVVCSVRPHHPPGRFRLRLLKSFLYTTWEQLSYGCPRGILHRQAFFLISDYSNLFTAFPFTEFQAPMRSKLLLLGEGSRLSLRT